MGAGVSQKVMNGYYYRRLKKIQIELDQAGVCSTYSRGVLSGHDEYNTKAYWTIGFRTLRASNGETAGLIQVNLSADACMPNWPMSYDWSQHELGIQRIKQRFDVNRFKTAVTNAEETLADALDDTSALGPQDIAELRADVARAKEFQKSHIVI